MSTQPTTEDRERCLTLLHAQYAIAVVRERTHVFVEAFALMAYIAQDGSNKSFSLWNSRNGVTPFVAFIEGVEYQHIDMHLDRCIPTHIPDDGDYMFVDLTPEFVLDFTIARVDREWEGGEYSMSKQWQTRWAAVTSLVATTYESSVPSYLIQITPELAAQRGWPELRQQAKDRLEIPLRRKDGQPMRTPARGR